MKNHFILFLLALCTQPVFAQKFSYGLKIAANIHDWYFDTGSKEVQLSGINYSLLHYKPDLSGEFGVTAKYQFGNRLALNSEILYAQRNVTYNNGLTYKNQYLAVPLFASVKVYKPLSLDLGMEYSRLYKSNIFYYKEYFFDNLDFWSGVVGIRYDFLKHFNIHGRYVHSLNKIQEITWTDFNATEIGKSKLRSRTFSLAVGYNF